MYKAGIQIIVQAFAEPFRAGRIGSTWDRCWLSVFVHGTSPHGPCDSDTASGEEEDTEIHPSM